MGMKNLLDLWLYKGIVLLWCMLGSGQVFIVAGNVKEIQHKGVRPVFAWRIQDKEAGATVFLMGSIHVGKKEFYPLPQVIEKAFRESDALAVEVDTSSAFYLYRKVTYF